MNPEKFIPPFLGFYVIFGDLLKIACLHKMITHFRINPKKTNLNRPAGFSSGSAAARSVAQQGGPWGRPRAHRRFSRKAPELFGNPPTLRFTILMSHWSCTHAPAVHLLYNGPVLGHPCARRCGSEGTERPRRPTQTTKGTKGGRHPSPSSSEATGGDGACGDPGKRPGHGDGRKSAGHHTFQ